MGSRASLLTENAAAAAVGDEPRELRNLVVPGLSLNISGHHLSASLLDRQCVEIRPELHPGLRRWLTASGWETTVADAKLPSGVGAAEAFAAAGAALGSEAAISLRSGQRTVLTFGSLQAVISRRRVRALGPTKLLTVFQALRWLEEQEPALVVVDRQWHRLSRLACSAATFCVADNPAQVLLRTQHSEISATPLVAAGWLERDSDSRPVVVSADAVDLMDMAAAGPAGRAGLYPHQDDAVSVLNSSDIGAVLATPPGGGKTVVCAAALESRTFSGRVLVAAPVAVLTQWADELNRWAPSILSSVAPDVERLRRQLLNSDVVVTSHDVAARWGKSARTPLALVVLDEAAVLLRRSRRADGLWRLRELSERAWALSGTPQERRDSDVAELVAWARARPRGSVVAAAVEEFAPVVTGLQGCGTSPTIRLVLSPVEPTAADTSWVERLRSSGAGLSGFSAAQARDRARVGLGDPLAVGHEPSWEPSKRAAVLARLAEHAAAGRSALLFSASSAAVAALTAMLREKGVAAAMLDSSLSRSRRVGILGAFAAGGLSVLAITPSSQRGVNLQAADLVVHLDLPASSAEFTQRNARAARIGSTHSEVEVWVPYIAGTWDELWVGSALHLGEFDPFSATFSG